MSKLSLIGAIFLSFASHAQAQTFEQWIQRSQADYRSADNDLRAKIQDASTPPCEIVKAKFNRNYANWYQQNAAQIQAMYNSFEGVIRYANGKINELRTMSFQPVIEQGQAKDPKVTFQTAADYIRDLSARKKTAIENDQLAVHQKLVKDPEVSPFNLSLEQVVASLKGMSSQMNASLKEQGVEFEIVFQDTKDGYSLELQVSIQNSAKKIKLDLLSTSAPVEISISDRWSILSSSKLGNYSIDAFLRYKEMVAASDSPECLTALIGSEVNKPYSNLTELIRNALAKSPFLQLINASHAVCTIGKSIEVELANRSGRVTRYSRDKYNNPYAPLRIQLERSRFEVQWSSYSYFAIEQKPDGTLNSPYGAVTCTF